MMILKSSSSVKRGFVGRIRQEDLEVQASLSWPAQSRPCLLPPHPQKKKEEKVGGGDCFNFT
jgi:hypothetical protein